MLFILPFQKITTKNVAEAGGKGASLGEMTKAGISVPPGFVILAGAFEYFIEQAGLAAEIESLLGKVKHTEMHTVEEASKTIRLLIEDNPFPKELANDIIVSYKKLNATYVAVRSSATAEDGVEHAWAGQLDTYLNTTEQHVLENVKKCWASLFTPRAIFYRFEKGLHGMSISVAVVIQKMVQSEVSGVAFSVHPVTEDRNQMIIEAGFGLGEAIVSGQITPDSYVVQKEPRQIIDRMIVRQERALHKSAVGDNAWVTLTAEYGGRQALADGEILELAELILRIEKHYGFPCDVEWAREDGKFFITQSRPITTLSNKQSTATVDENEVLFAKIKAVDWKYLVNRREALLFRSLTTFCYEDFEEVTGIPWKPTKEFRPEADVLYSAKELGDLARKFSEGGAPLLHDFGERLVKHVSALFAYTTKAAHINYTKCTQKELQTHFDAYLTRVLKAQNFLLPMPIADQVISRLIVERLSGTEAEKQRWLATLTYPEKENEHTKEERSFYRLVIAHKKHDSKFEAQLAEHTREFAWVGARWFWWQYAWTKKDIQARIDEFLAQGNDPEAALKHINAIKKDKLHESEALARQLKIDPSSELASLIVLAKEFAYLRTWRTDVLYQCGYILREMFFEIVRRANVAEDAVPYLTHKELLAMLTTKNSPVSEQEIADRKIFFGTIHLNGEYKVFSGEKWRVPLRSLYSLGETVSGQELKGTIAYTGKATGKVAKVYTTNDLAKVQRGDILVTVMTFPNFIPAMEKAAAFVTDEGGILCHAAIVSREMKKPCIIGTKLATHVLQDGDLVEVDATAGIITLVS